MNHYDVIVVGAGPAGSTCAARLNQQGFRVKLFDKTVFPRVKPCAGWITPPVVENLKLDLEFYRQSRTLQPIRGFQVGLIEGRTSDIEFSQTVSYGIRRCEFDDYLLRRCGVECEFEAVTNLERDGGQWVVNESNTAPLVIGAGGHFCPVARRVRDRTNCIADSVEPASANGLAGDDGSMQPVQPVVFAQEVEFECPTETQAALGDESFKPKIYFCNDLSGYGWCFRKGNYLNIGLGRTEKSGLAERVQAFCRFLRRQHPDLPEIPDRFAGHAYRLYANAEPPLVADGVLLIGDAAGLAHPYSGEGIRPATESAIIAANVVLHCQGDYQAASLSRYQTQMLARFGRPPALGKASWIPSSWAILAATQLLKSSWFSKNIVIHRWFLNRHLRT